MILQRVYAAAGMLQGTARLQCRSSKIPAKRLLSTDLPPWDSIMSDSTKALAESITSTNNTSGPIHRRVAISRAITLMESKNARKKQQADSLLTHLLSKRPVDQQPTLRVGFAGPPGVGKSSLLEAFGMHLLTTNKVKELAVVCIDPSSNISGGSILGDKTRMTELSRQDRAYVRPSSNSGVLGGLAAYTDDVVSTLSAAGYPLVLVETVGLGQSEVEIAESVDVLVLLLAPGGGDGLQGVKKGIVELASILAVTKADGDLLSTAKSTASDYRGALRILQYSSAKGSASSCCGEDGGKAWQPPVLLTSSVTKEGLDELWESIIKYREHLETTGEWEARRKKQAQYWMWKQFTRMMQERMQSDPVLANKATYLESELLQGHLTPRVAAQELLDGVFGMVRPKS
jgi:LAO/AO transport system kinase